MAKVICEGIKGIKFKTEEKGREFNLDLSGDSDIMADQLDAAANFVGYAADDELDVTVSPIYASDAEPVAESDTPQPVDPESVGL